MDHKKVILEHASLQWRDNSPFSSQFDDVYFSSDNGLAQSRHVFIEANDLDARFASLEAHSCFVIAETGFGSGLNFLLTWQCWKVKANDQARLSYYSIERYPLTIDDLKRCLAMWPSLNELSNCLIQQYQHIVPGFQVLDFSFDRVRLILIIDDVLDAIKELPKSIDTWFLDGFSPQKNPAMWGESVMLEMAHRSHSQTSLSTFTCAPSVRKQLQDLGFAVEKTTSFDCKQEMLLATTFTQKVSSPYQAPWFSLKNHSQSPCHSKKSTVIIIGAGLAGVCCAQSLANRGLDVTVLDHCDPDEPDNRGACPDFAMNYVRFYATDILMNRWNRQAYVYFLKHIEQLKKKHPTIFECSGLVQRMLDQKMSQRQRLIEENNALGDLCEAWTDDQLGHVLNDLSLNINHQGDGHGAMYLPHSGVLNSKAYYRANLEHSLIQTSFGTDVAELQYDSKEQAWHVYDQAGEVHRADHVVIAAGHLSQQFLSAGITDQLRYAKGQVSYFSSENSISQKIVLCGRVYLINQGKNQVQIGASFEHDYDHLLADPHLDLENLAQIEKDWPGLTAQLGLKKNRASQAGVRVYSKDYLPLIGPLFDETEFNARYGSITEDAKKRFYTAAPELPNLYLCTGFGSRGISSSALAGEVIADYVCSHASCIPESLRQGIHPVRMLLQSLLLKPKSG